jgi:virulence-associated protein VagC
MNQSGKPLELTVFKSGNSSALRLPRDLGFSPGEKVVVYRDGEALILKHVDPMGWPVGYFDSWQPSKIELPARIPATERARLERLFTDEEGGKH